jgi:hypothetical protein
MHGDTEQNIPADGETAEVEVPIRLLSLDDAALSLGKITVRELRKRLDAGDIGDVYIGRRRMVPLDEIDAYIERLKAKRKAA